MIIFFVFPIPILVIKTNATLFYGIVKWKKKKTAARLALK